MSSLILTLTLAILLFLLPIAAFVPPAPAPSRFPPKKTMSDLNRPLHRPPPTPTCFSSLKDCVKRRRHHPTPPPPKDHRSRDFGRNLGIAFAGIAILLQLVLGGFLVFKRIQLKKGFHSLPSTSTP